MGERPFAPDFENEQEVVRLQQLLEDIKNGSFARVYLLYGEETYLRLQYRDKLKKALIPDGDTMNYHYFEGKGVETAQLIDLSGIPGALWSLHGRMRRHCRSGF